MAIRIGMNGAGGRMGQRVVALTLADKELTLAAALESKASRSWAAMPENSLARVRVVSRSHPISPLTLMSSSTSPRLKD